jgi:predicted permease
MTAYSLLLRKLAALRSWSRSIGRRDDLEAEMQEELANHLACLQADLERTGLPPTEAGRRARIALGPALVHKEAMRASLGLRWCDELRADLRYGARMLRKSPGFTAIAVGSLALAIGANTTIFAVGKRMLFDRLAVPHPEQLRMLRWNGDGKNAVHHMWGDFDSNAQGEMTSSVFSYPVYQQMRAHNQAIQELFAFKEDGMNATVRGHAQRVSVAMVSGNYYDGLNVHPQVGRAIGNADDAIPGSGAVAVISDELWQREFDRSPAVLGQTITLNQMAMTVIGVNPRGFTGAKDVQESPDIFIPLGMQPAVDPKGKKSLLTDPDSWWLNVMGRAQPGLPDAKASAALDVALQAAVRATMTLKVDETTPRLDLADGARGLHYDDQTLRKPVYVLMALTGFVLLLACANVANLLMARGAQRQREMGMRLALGAGRARIVRQLLTESLMLAVLGGLAGSVLSYLGRNGLPKLLTNSWEQSSFETPFDWKVFGFTASVTLATGLLFGLAPAWMAMRAEVNSTLKDSAQNATRRRKGTLGKSLVAFQIALSTVLVIGAGLFLHTLFLMNSIDVGFKADNLLLFEIDPPAQRYPEGKDIQLHGLLEQRFASVPGVESVATGIVPYLADNMSNSDFYPEGDGLDHSKRQAEDFNVVGVDFFKTLGIPVIAGRSFGRDDTATSPKVGIINEALAQKRFPGVNPVGKKFRANQDVGDWIEIVGICANTRYSKLREAPPPQFFLPYVQQPGVGGMVYQVRTRMAASTLAPTLRRVVQQVDPDLPITDVRTQREQINATMQLERAFAALSAGFGMLALALACVGIYGVMAYSVANRTNEIGIRLALGARQGQVRGMILRESSWLSFSGIALGGAAALLLARVVKSMLYGIQPYDPLTLVAGVLLLLAVALAASWIPARRAAGVEPMEALRHE